MFRNCYKKQRQRNVRELLTLWVEDEVCFRERPSCDWKATILACLVFSVGSNLHILPSTTLSSKYGLCLLQKTKMVMAVIPSSRLQNQNGLPECLHPFTAFMREVCLCIDWWISISERCGPNHHKICVLVYSWHSTRFLTLKLYTILCHLISVTLWCLLFRVLV